MGGGGSMEMFLSAATNTMTAIIHYVCNWNFMGVGGKPPPHPSPTFPHHCVMDLV